LKNCELYLVAVIVS